MQSAPSGQLPYVGSPESMGFRSSYDQDDIMANRCQVQATSFGKNAAKAICNNPTNAARRVRIPKGYMFRPEGPDMQTLITERDVEFWVYPGQTVSQNFDAFCGYSKGRVPSGQMYATGLAAPADVLGSQSQVWQWTRAWERPKQKPNTGMGWLKSLGARSAAQEAKILQKSYGIDTKQHRALQERLDQIDKDPKRHQRRAGSSNTPPPSTSHSAPGGKSKPPAQAPRDLGKPRDAKPPDLHQAVPPPTHPPPPHPAPNSSQTTRTTATGKR